MTTLLASKFIAMLTSSTLNFAIINYISVGAVWIECMAAGMDVDI